MISIFPLWTFHLYVATFQQHLHMEYISQSQMIRYSRACGSYQYVLDRGLLLIMKLLNQRFLLVMLVEHIRGHLWHRYCITVNQVMVATVTFSKWWLQHYQKEPLVQ
jgi:hypothetical protein